MNLMLIKDNNIRDNPLHLVREVISTNTLISIIDTCPSRTRSKLWLYTLNIEKSVDLRFIQLMPFSNYHPVVPCFVAIPLKSRSLTYPRRPSIIAYYECDPLLYYLIYTRQLSMNKCLDNVLVCICNWNPREKKGDTNRNCTSEMGIRWMRPIYEMSKDW